MGLHPSLAKLKGLYDQGKVAVMQGVGYPNPNRSHFRSMDIWHSATPESFESSGWLGRYISACECARDNALPAISVGDQLNGMFWTDTTLVPAVASVGAFSFLTDTKYKNDRTWQLQTLQNIYGQAGNWPEYEALIRRGTVNALAGSDALQKVAATYTTPISYPANNGLANQLKLVAQVIAGDLGTRLFSVSMGGFDTHANQKDRHAQLLTNFGDAVDAFMQDLANMNKQDDVVIMTFSEFGRRAKQNGSSGTDHGTAEPMFVIGNKVRGGIFGSYPSLDGPGQRRRPQAHGRLPVGLRGRAAAARWGRSGADRGRLQPGSGHRVKRRSACVATALLALAGSSQASAQTMEMTSVDIVDVPRPQERWGYAPRTQRVTAGSWVTWSNAGEDAHTRDGRGWIV